MANRIEAFEFGKRSKYPWEEWLDGSIWKATRGEDFTIEAENFKAVVYAAATKHGKKGAVKVVDDNTVVFQAHPSNKNGAQ